MSDDSPMESNMARALDGREQAIVAAATLRRHAREQRSIQRQAILGAGQRIDPADRKQAKSAERRRKKSEWQKDAWAYYDNVPELGHGGRFFGNNLAKLQLYPAIIVEDGQPPVRYDATDAEGNPYLTEAEQAVVRGAVDRIASEQGGHAEILRDYGINAWVAGECTLLGLPDEDAPDGETWGIYSTSELYQRDGKWVIKEDPDQPDNEVTPVPDDAPMYRLWIKHPQWKTLPDSPSRRVLEVCDELMLLTRAIRSAATSRVQRGVFVIPESALTGPPDITENAETDGEAFVDPTIASIIEHFVTPIADPGSASGFAPYVMAVPDEVVEKVTYIDFGQTFDPAEAAVRDELIRRLANGVDLPPEVLLGIADLNHWSAWMIDEQTFESYLEPYAQNLVLSLTWAYYRPALRAAGFTDADRHVIWYDDSELVGPGDQREAADKGQAAGLIGDETWRRVHNFTEEDAPTIADDERRLALQRGIIGEQATNVLLQAIGLLSAAGIAVPSDSAEAQATPAVDTTATEVPTERPEPDRGPPDAPPDLNGEAPAMTGASFSTSERSRLAILGERLGRIDQALRARLSAAVDASMRRALERAGARLRSRALRASASYRDAIDGVPNERVAAALGEAIVAAIGEDTDSLLRDSFDDLRDRFYSWTEQAQAAALREMQRAGVNLSDAELEEIRSAQRSDRDAAWALLSAELVRQAHTVLYSPEPTAPEAGEFDGTTVVPSSIVRQALARAGGAEGAATPGGVVLVGPNEAPAGSVATGQRASDLLATINVRTAGYVWLYGDPGSRTTNFEPHEALDGVEFSSFTDPVLANPASWPPVPYLYPGDHRYCQCDFAPVLREDTTSPSAPATLAP